MKLKYTAPCFDHSGYGEASRHDVKALVDAGVQLTLQIPKYTQDVADFGQLGELCQSLENLVLGYRIKIIHTTPNVYPMYFEAEKYHIGRVFWETDKLPLDFAKEVEKCDEIWTGSVANENAIRKAGVTKPIHIIPEAITTDIIGQETKPYHTVADGTYKFYSIFEFIERKNPGALLLAYWQEFQNDENVSLTLKTYRDNFMASKNDEIDAKIKYYKKQSGLAKFPPVYLYRYLMDRSQIHRFHASFDCFVSAHRGEGWGIPQVEAMLHANPVISTGYGGVHEYIDTSNGMMIDFDMVQVSGEIRNANWYRDDQNWAEVSIPKLRKAMRFAYEHQKEMRAMGEKAQQLVINTFSTRMVGSMMRKRLDEIVANNYGEIEP
jgi:glycosyltransferase involved in cell wall biosynthesis